MEQNLLDRIGVLEQVNFDLEESNAMMAKSDTELAELLAEER